jgi:hypothetical protein
MRRREKREDEEKWKDGNRTPWSCVLLEKLPLARVTQ